MHRLICLPISSYFQPDLFSSNYSLLPNLCFFPPFGGVLPITEGPHSLQQAPSPLSFWWTGLIVVKHHCCCGIDSIWFLNWSLSCTSPSRLTGWMAYFLGANVYLPSDLTICCDLATQVNEIFFFFPSLSLSSFSLLRELPWLRPLLFRHQPLGNDEVYGEIDGCAWCFSPSMLSIILCNTLIQSVHCGPWIETKKNL